MWGCGVSVSVMTEIFKRYPNGGGEMVLALALADHAHDDGTHIWPSIGQLAKKTRQSDRTVQYQLRKMEESGWLILMNDGKGGRNMHREYRISAEWLNGADFASLKKGANDDINGATGDVKGANDDNKGCSPLHPHVNVKEPSKKHQESSARGTRLPKEWLLPKSWGLWALNEFPTWTEDHVRTEADKFRDYWVALPGKAALKLDWEATWRNWCRNAGPMRTATVGGGAWWATPESKLEKANEVGVGAALPGETDMAWTARIRAAIDNGGKPPAPKAKPVVEVRETVEQIEKGEKGIPEEVRKQMLQAAGLGRRLQA